MLLNKRCTVCHGKIDPANAIVCETCAKPIHDSCAEFEQRYNCKTCADEPKIGAQEF